MAIKTITLRPTSSGLFNPSGTLSYDISSMTYPATSDDTKIYLLINEEIPDNDATYYKPHQLYGQHIGFRFTPPDEYKSLLPESIRIYLSSASELNATLRIIIHDLSNTTHVDAIKATLPASTEYNTTCHTVSQDLISATWTVLTSADAAAWSPLMRISTTKSGSSKTSNTKITQFYIEADFEVEDSSSIYVRKNGSFVEVAQTYKKVNGAWTEITTEECKSLIQSHS